MTFENPVVESAMQQTIEQPVKPIKPVPQMLPESVLSDLSNSARFNQSNNQQSTNQSAKKPPVTPSRNLVTIPKPFNLHTAKRAHSQPINQTNNHTANQPNQPVNHTNNQQTNRLPRSAVINTPRRAVPKFNHSNNPTTPSTNQPTGTLTFSQHIAQPVFPTIEAEDFSEDATSLAFILNPQATDQTLDPVQMADRLSIASKRRANIDRGSIYGGAGRVLCRSQTPTSVRRSTLIPTSSNSRATLTGLSRPIGFSSAFNSHFTTPARRAPKSLLTSTPVTNPRPVKTNENVRK